jgi:hypothetical protein
MHCIGMISGCNVFSVECYIRDLFYYNCAFQVHCSVEMKIGRMNWEGKECYFPLFGGGAENRSY